MNTKLLLLAILVAAFSSCTTLYKAGQTPDDVYYSPVRLSGGAVESTRDQQPDRSTAYNSEYRTIRLGIGDPRWRYLDYNYSYGSDLYLNDYSYTPYSYGYNYGYYYNPLFYPYPVYGYGSIFVTPVTPKSTTPRMTSLSAYNPVYNNAPVMTSHGMAARPVRTYNNVNNTNRGSAVGNVMRNILTPNNNNSSNSNNNNSSSNNTRTYTPSTSSSSSSSGGSSSGGGGAISRPPRN